jgi:hypothetical protein
MRCHLCTQSGQSRRPHAWIGTVLKRLKHGSRPQFLLI